jgi:hypothetical protein
MARAPKKADTIMAAGRRNTCRLISAERRYPVKHIDRRALLTGMGIGSLAPSALLGALAEAQPAPGDVGPLATTKRVAFDLATVATSGIVNGQQVSAFITGEGTVNGKSVSGSGRIVLFNQIGRAPKSIFQAGTWQARKLLSATFIGTFGGLVAGEILFEGRFFIQGVKLPQLIRLQIVANLPVAGLRTGDPGVLQLSLPGTIFDPGHDAGPFVTLGRRKARGFYLRAA